MGQDAEYIFWHPEEFNLLKVEMIEQERSHGIFIPATMSIDIPKIETNLSKYLEVKSGTELDLIPIFVTPPNAEELVIKARAEKAKSENTSDIFKFIMYYPLKPEECFLSPNRNEFPVDAITELLAYLDAHSDQEDVVGTNVRLFRDVEGNVKHSLDTPYKPITDFPVTGSTIKEAPVVIYEFPKEKGPYLYIAGGDPYNTSETMSSPSLGSVHIYKRMYDPLHGTFQKSCVASYTARPKTMKEWHEVVELLLEFYNATILPENEAGTFLSYFDQKNKGYLIADGYSLAKEINPSTSILGRDKGLAATTPNINFGMNLFYQYANEEIQIGTNPETKEPIKKLGVWRIRDRMLLKEMLAYRPNKKGEKKGNFDRCFTENHSIITSNGYKDISKIENGDIVLTHSGEYKEVYELFKNKYENTLYRIKPLGNDKFIECTANHPFLIGRYSKKPTGKYWYKRKYNLDNIDWVEAKDIVKGDFLFIPFKKNRTERILNDDILYLLGWYLSDGNISKANTLRICFQGNQIEMANRCKEILEKYDNFEPTYFEATHHMTGNKFISHSKKEKPAIKKITNKYAFTLSCTSEWFNNIVKEYVTILEGGEKILNQNLINQENLIPLILGFLEGDGSQSIRIKDNTFRNSISVAGTYKTLLYQFREIILNEGIWCTISPTIVKRENYNNQLRIDIQDWKGLNKIVENSLKFQKVDLFRKQKENFIKTEDGFWIPIKQIETIDFKGDVYNFEVKDNHSYTVDLIATHNCVSFRHALMYDNYLEKHMPLIAIEQKSDDTQQSKNKILRGPFDLNMHRNPFGSYSRNPFGVNPK